ncbi:MAG: prolipoprotein diacylglyceryl transferase [Bacteroidetes bacterium]|nr:prolipoprotein diacylglyceryl transferase [Bacteroidota bacterium]
MYPKLFEIGPVPIYSYGLMLGIAFLVGSSLLTKELRRNGMDENMGVMITFLSLIGGIVGSKLFYIIEEWNFGSGEPLSSFFTVSTIFSPSGLTFYGGLILAIVLVLIYCKVKDIPVLKLFDMMSPSAAIGYSIARIGCHLSGDGDYGIPVNGTFWEFLGYSYSKGTVPTHEGVLVHPTPVYETVVTFFIFLFLWRNRAKYKTSGIIFAYFLILSGIERFLVEIIRLNPRIIFGLSQAQIISVIMIIGGLYLLKIKKSEEKKLTEA